MSTPTYIGPGAASGWSTPVVEGATPDAQAQIDTAIKDGAQIVTDIRAGVARIIAPNKPPVAVAIKAKSLPIWVWLAGAGVVGVGAWLLLKGDGNRALPMSGSGIQLREFEPEDRLDGIKKRKPNCRKVKKGSVSFTVCK